MSKLFLLQCVSCLSPAKSFAAFYTNKLLKMIEFYPNDFIDVPEVALRHQLKNHVTNVWSDPKFAKLKGLLDLSWLVHCWLLQKVRRYSTTPNLWRIILWSCYLQALDVHASSSPRPPLLFEYDKGGEMNWFYLVYFKTGKWWCC